MKTITLVANGLQMTEISFKKSNSEYFKKLSFVMSRGGCIGTIDFEKSKLVRLYKDGNTYELRRV